MIFVTQLGLAYSYLLLIFYYQFLFFFQCLSIKLSGAYYMILEIAVMNISRNVYLVVKNKRLFSQSLWESNCHNILWKHESGV
jgi:hypothetical protein